MPTLSGREAERSSFPAIGKPFSFLSIKKAAQLEDLNVQYAYLYFLSLDNIGKTKQSLDAIKSSLLKYSNNDQLINLGLSFSKKLTDKETYQYLMNIKNKHTDRNQ